MTTRRPLPLDGVTVVVTGASAGLGAAIAMRMSADGANVAALDVQPPPRFDPSPTMRAWHCDITDDSEISAVVSSVAAEFGGIDVLVNNAGILSGRRTFLDATRQELHHYFDVNAAGAVLMTQACFPHLQRSTRPGRVINICSRTFFTGAVGQVAYVASKGALLGITRVLARELGEHGITVNAAVPAQVATTGTRAHSTDDTFAATMSQQAIKQFVTPSEFAGTVAFLASPDARMITGQTLVADGGGLLH